MIMKFKRRLKIDDLKGSTVLTTSEMDKVRGGSFIDTLLSWLGMDGIVVEDINQV